MFRGGHAGGCRALKRRGKRGWANGRLDAFVQDVTFEVLAPGFDGPIYTQTLERQQVDPAAVERVPDAQFIGMTFTANFQNLVLREAGTIVVHARRGDDEIILGSLKVLESPSLIPSQPPAA